MQSLLHTSKVRLTEGLSSTPPDARRPAPDPADPAAFAPGGEPLPLADDSDGEDRFAPRLDRHGFARPWWRRPGALFGLLVLLPTLFLALFEYGVAADQFESEAHFIVRSPQPMGGGGSIGQLLGLAPAPPPADAHSVGDYLLSHDAVDALRASIDLPALFRRPEADPVSRLWGDAPPRETLLKYYRGMVHVTYSGETGITSLTVRAFRPADAHRLAEALLRLGEARVNALNDRMFENGLAAAHRQVAEAQANVTRVRGALTAFRQQHRDLDPDRSGSAQIELSAQLQQEAARARAQFQAMAAAISPGAPQYAAAARRVRELEARVQAARTGLAGSRRSIAATLGEYEELRQQQELAAKAYEVAAIGLQTARENLVKQQLFIIPVVKPDLPEKATFPKRLQVIATAFFGLALLFALGWLLLAGIREHAI